MAYNEELSLRVQKYLFDLNVDFFEKKMFGGNTFMINDKMCIGIVKNELMLRVLDTEYESLVEKNHVRPMNFTGKTMKDFLYIDTMDKLWS
jgi:TfoX/Sxy family transcriptional regulator of competence genes